MTALLLTALVTAVAANVSLVVFVADRLSPQTASGTSAPKLVAGNSNVPAVAQLAA